MPGDQGEEMEEQSSGIIQFTSNLVHSGPLVQSIGSRVRRLSSFQSWLFHVGPHSS